MVCKLFANSSAIACQWFYNTLVYALGVYSSEEGQLRLLSLSLLSLR